MKLLLAEDERALSNVLVTILRHSGYTVDAVYNGADALDYLACGAYDGVILDIMMPKVDGIEVLRTIRAAGNKVPVLLLTAKSDVDDKVAGLDCGADDYLTKPFVTKELLARLRAITRRQGGEGHNSLVYGDLRLDRASFELSSAGGKLALTAKEFQIMEMLMRDPSRVISAERFMDADLGARQRRGDKCCVDVYLISAQKAEAARLPRYDKSREEYRLHIGVRKCLKS